MALKLNKPTVLGVLAGRDYPIDRLKTWLTSADFVVAADGGANLCFEADFSPNLTVGDLDSIRPEVQILQQELVPITDQNFTDCDKLLQVVYERGYEEVSLIGIEGNLFDHMIGSLLSAAKSPLRVRLILREGIGLLIKGPFFQQYNLPSQTRLSLLPLSICQGVTLTGAQWPLEKAQLDPLGLTSLSNRGSGHVTISLESGFAVLFLSHPEFQKVHWQD